MAEHDPETAATPPPARRGLGADWWAVIASGAVVALAALGVLPRIPW
ncbi:MAG: hypothetical protein ACRC20_09310 [Segniliparus sp.]